MLQGYPFWVDAAGTPTILDPILEAAATVLTFRGEKRDVKIMGASVAGDTPTHENIVRFKIGNSTPDYKYMDLSPNAFDHDTGLAPSVGMINYTDFGGVPIQEGEVITISFAGTGAVSGVLWVEDGEPGPIPIPNGDIVMLRCGKNADGAAALSTTGAGMDARKLENNRLYTPFMVEVHPEDDSVEVVILRAGKDSMTLPPVGRMVYPYAPLQFTGLQYNTGGVVMKIQVAAAAEVEVLIWCIESPIPNQVSSPNAPTIVGVSGMNIPGVINAAGIVGNNVAIINAGTLTNPATGTNLGSFNLF